ncbi:hypothetical protein ELI15_36760 [Rhizobium ruizarguesonis]|nr:hypothetical protein ELI15_36760 [Rhizobium ruizarguesonis]TBY60774.1 hypothetical protein E0H46_30585 [Rhizobium leguminosarum bv. viciae]TAY41708.1 hypothetical protein ELH88_36380 [Rhizobium ruizarguesonis]TAZ43887.1 hypothetical protein ELH71_36425 [Rhizobium ruizarguesonis]TAZ70611.1 hypothetical protein ELH72_32240 [Rhizobium ruizarguesonis]
MPHNARSMRSDERTVVPEQFRDALLRVADKAGIASPTVVHRRQTRRRLAAISRPNSHTP